MQLNERDKRALFFGVIGVIIVGIYWFSGPWLDEWVSLRQQVIQARKDLQAVSGGPEGTLSAAQKAKMAIVPTFKMPAADEQQRILFRDTLTKQLKDNGISFKQIDYLAARKTAANGMYKTLRIQCQGKCQLQQLLTLLSKLNENPYFVGIEELTIKPNPQKREETDFTLTLSSFSR